MHQAVFLGAVDDLQRLLTGDLLGAAGADVVLSALAHLHAHVLVKMAAAVVDAGAAGAAGAGGHAERVVLVEIVAQTVVGLDVINALERTLDGGDAHQTVAVREDRRHGLHADAGVLLKRLADLGMAVQQLRVVDQHLHDAGREDLHEVAILPVRRVRGAAEHTDPGQVVGELLGLLDGEAGLLCQILDRALLAQAGGDGDISLVIRDDIHEGVILRGVLVDLVDHTGQTADDLT